MALLSDILCVLLLCNIALAQEDGDVRLENGDTYLEGRVEIFHDGEWGTVCDDRFGEAEGIVICNSLGFPGLHTAFSRAAYGEGTGAIWMDELGCSGDEEALTACWFAGWGNHDCSHREDAGVKCNPKPVKVHNITALPLRISCPPNSTTCNACPLIYDKCSIQSVVKGILEAQYEGQWYPVSGEGWGVEEVSVACGQLGYPASWTPPSLDQLWTDWDAPDNCSTNSSSESKDYRNHLKKVLLKDIICTGYEQTLLNCTLASVGIQNLTSVPLHTKSVATVECGYYPPQIEDCYPSNFELYRLRGGPLPWSGRVEVKVAGIWTTVCDDGWNVKAARVVCRALGYGTPKSIHTHSHFGSGSGDVGYAGLQCSDYATTLGMCSKSSTVPTRCKNHGGDAGVVCHHPQPNETCPDAGPYSRLHTVTYRDGNGARLVQHLLEIKHNNVWGRVCYEAVDIHVANTACKESQGMFVDFFEAASPPDDPSYLGLRFNGNILCHGEETSIDQCLFQLTGSYEPCSHGYAALFCIEGISDLVPNLEQFELSLTRYPYADLLPMYHLVCAVDDNCLASSASNASLFDYRSLLRFDSLTMNLGTRDFRPHQSPSTWIWHNCHRHYHSYEAFIHYDILDTSGKQVAEGHKASFCLEDSTCQSGQNPTYSCLAGTQGISPNCGDLYGRYLDCQWIDITGLSPGTYVIRQEVNADRLVPESDYRNNIIECSITLYQIYMYHYYSVGSGSCSHSDH